MAISGFYMQVGTYNLPLVNETLTSRIDIFFLLDSFVYLRFGVKPLNIDINFCQFSLPVVYQVIIMTLFLKLCEALF